VLGHNYFYASNLRQRNSLMVEKLNITNDDDATLLDPIAANTEVALNQKSSAITSQMQPIYEDATSMTNNTPVTDSLAYRQLEIGSTIKDTFGLVAVLGEGGMGTVYKALNKVWEDVGARDPYVAIKVLKPELSANKQLVRSLYSDFDRTKMLANCPNIIKVYGFDRDGPLVYMTMEYLKGQTLGEYLNHQSMNLAQAWFIIEGIGNALTYAHEKNIVHRDIKPGNVIITDDGIAKVLDFGIASKVNEHEGDETKFGGHELGAFTVAYASPEMQRDYLPDARDDIYAFACVIYEILTGKQFYKQKIRKAPPIKGLNSRQMEALNKALAFERDYRTASVHELLDNLRPVKIPWLKFLGIGSGMLIFIALVLWRMQSNDKQPSDLQLEHPSVTREPSLQKSIPAPVFTPTQPSATSSLPDKKNISKDAPAVPTSEPIPISGKLNNSSTSNDGIIHIQTSKPEYKIGEFFQLIFTLTEPKYIRVIDRDANGDVTMLRPNPRQQDILLSANKNHSFPPKGFTAPVKGPSGKSTVTIVVSSHPFSKAVKLLNADGTVSEQVKSGLYSWTQIQYTLHR
jgi:serine/threonine protein kinase